MGMLPMGVEIGHRINEILLQYGWKMELIDRVTGAMEEVKKLMGKKVSLVYVSMLPRFLMSAAKDT
jgi:hypothetical protein